MSINFEESVVDVSEAGALLLQDIFAMPEPKRTYYLRAWLASAEAADDGGIVKVATADRRPAKVSFNNDPEFNIPPRGRRVSRNAAIVLLRDFGEHGFYRGRDMLTGMQRDEWEALQYNEPDVAKRWAKHPFAFNEFYLVQIPFGFDPDDEVEEISKE